ncbi:uncharacterized protein UTRI_10420_B [Ustilago trichophora]|uniref:Uncharacterized protein n=1 Tax=Ustilago trichophora TaxID=86804 RepID=A0A5C3EBC3_9BASI|nr:uncharacterized protein UTRI_10420_B [Ustilago trichophora]
MSTQSSTTTSASSSPAKSSGVSATVDSLDLIKKTGGRNWIDDLSDEDEAVDSDDSDDSDYVYPVDVELTWTTIYDIDCADLHAEYLLNKNPPWSSDKMVLVLQRPDIIGLETQEQAQLSLVEKAKITASVFRGSHLAITCSNYKMARQLMSNPPTYGAFPMEIVSKPFGADHPEAYIYHCATFSKAEELDELVTNYIEGLPGLINTEHAIVMGQYYTFETGMFQVEERKPERVFTGTLVLVAGRLRPGELPPFEGAVPQKVEY